MHVHGNQMNLNLMSVYSAVAAEKLDRINYLCRRSCDYQF